MVTGEGSPAQLMKFIEEDEALEVKKVEIEKVLSLDPHYREVRKKALEERKTSEKASLNPDSSARDNGGIVLDAQKMQMDLHKEGKGVEMQFDAAQIAQFKRGDFAGLSPVINTITPLANPAVFLRSNN
jgi:hypothetical protein